MLDLTKHRLETPWRAAGVSLRKNNLDNVKMDVYCVVDWSKSMRDYFRLGDVQTFTDRILALGARLDDDGIIPVIFFGVRTLPAVTVTVNNHAGAVARIVDAAGGLGQMHGGTHYAPAIRTVRNLHRGKLKPALVVFQTDGNNFDKAETTRELVDAANEGLFWQFTGWGAGPFPYLHQLDTMGGRRVDNAGFFPAGDDPSAIGDEQLYDLILNGVQQWLTEATAAGIFGQ